jgi:hypothetical protein
MATDDNTVLTPEERKAAGRAYGLVRMRQLASERLAERQAITAQILSDLGRPATTLDRIAANNLAALHVRANQLEAMGKNADTVRQQITQAQRASGFKPQPVDAQKPDPLRAIQDHIDRQRAAAAAVQSVATLTEQPATETRMGLASSTEGCP